MAGSAALWCGAALAFQIAEIDNQSFHRGRQLLSESDTLQAQATKLASEANRLRKLATKELVQMRTDSGSQSSSLDRQVSGLGNASKVMVESVNVLRAQSRKLLDYARHHFAEGMRERWPSRLRNPNALSAAGGHAKGLDPLPTRAHNASRSSANPEESRLTQPSVATHLGMTLALVSPATQVIPKDLDLSSFSISRLRRFVGHIEVDDSRGAAGDVEIGKMHSWQLFIASIASAATSDVQIEFGGHMPGHVHGLPTQPRVVEQHAPGVFRIDGIRFQMAGWWVIELKISDGNDVDSIRFNLKL